MDAAGRSPAAVRRIGRANRRRARTTALPVGKRNSDGAVCVPPSDSCVSRRQRPHTRRHKIGSRKPPLPPAVRNSVGDVVVCAARPPTERSDQPDSERTPSSLILEQIDDIYGRTGQYFGGDRPRRASEERHQLHVDDERDQLVNDEDSV